MLKNSENNNRKKNLKKPAMEKKFVQVYITDSYNHLTI